MTAKTHKLDIFEVLAAADQRDFGFLARQPEDVRKGFAPPVFLRWASTVRGANQADRLMLINEIANNEFYAIWEHPELQYMLVALCGFGKRENHDWIEMPKSGFKSTKTHEFVAQYYPLASVSEIEFIVSQFTRDEFVDFVEYSGCSPEEAEEIIQAYDGKKAKKAKKR